MTHNIIHDEEKIKDLIGFHWLTDSFKASAPAFEQYAEHTLVKFIDEQVERLEELKQEEIDVCDDEDLDCRMVKVIRIAHNGVVRDQITHLQSLKAQLTKKQAC